MQHTVIVVCLLGLVSLAAAYPAYVYVEEPEQVERVQTLPKSLASANPPLHAGPLTSERYEIRPVATKKNLIGPAVNGHMLKQPLLRFDILWRKFAPNSKRSYEPLY